MLPGTIQTWGETAWHEPRFFGTLQKKMANSKPRSLLKVQRIDEKKDSLRRCAENRFIDQRVGSLYVMFFGTCMTQPRRLALTTIWGITNLFGWEN